jgi:hypothetical protein
MANDTPTRCMDWKPSEFVCIWVAVDSIVLLADLLLSYQGCAADFEWSLSPANYCQSNNPHNYWWDPW